MDGLWLISLNTAARVKSQAKLVGMEPCPLDHKVMWYLLEAFFGYRTVPVWPISAKLALIKIQLTLISASQNPINAN